MLFNEARGSFVCNKKYTMIPNFDLVAGVIKKNIHLHTCQGYFSNRDLNGCYCNSILYLILFIRLCKMSKTSIISVLMQIRASFG